MSRPRGVRPAYAHAESLQSAVNPVERSVLYAMVAAYYVILALAVTGMDRIVLAVAGVIGFGGLPLLAIRWGRLDRPGKEPIAIWLGATLLFLLPVAFLPPPRGHAFLAAALAILCAQGLWAIYRYAPPSVVRPTRHRSLGQDLRWGIRWGLATALLFSLYALGIFVFASVGARTNYFASNSPWLVVVSYFAGGIGGGVIAGLLRPLARWALGTMVMGILAAFPVYGAVALIMPLIDEESAGMSLHELLLITVACALMIGPPAALSFRRGHSDD
ncbi:MAG TPA: hypothetical protein VF166_02495 [Gemmatimonadaceae bacterium]